MWSQKMHPYAIKLPFISFSSFTVSFFGQFLSRVDFLYFSNNWTIMKQSEQSTCQIISTSVRAVFEIGFRTVSIIVSEGEGAKHRRVGPSENIFWKILVENRQFWTPNIFSAKNDYRFINVPYLPNRIPNYSPFEAFLSSQCWKVGFLSFLRKNCYF